MTVRFKLAMTSMLALAVAAAPVAVRAEDPPLKVQSPTAVKGMQSVVIAAFNVGFIFESIDRSASTGGMIGAFGGATRAKSVLEGVSPEMMQAITDRAYDDFRTQIAARGLTVADGATIFTGGALDKAKPMTAPYDTTIPLEKNGKGKVSFFKPSALPGMMMLPGDIMMTGFSAIGFNMNAGTTQAGMAQHARANNVTVIDVVYVIDFSASKRPGAFSFGGLQVNSGMAVVDEYSKVNAIAPSGKVTTIVIKQPVAVEGDFADKKDATKDKGLQSAANVAGGVAAAFGLGGMKFGKSRTFVFTAKPTYSDGAVKAASLANTRVVDQLAALR